MVPVMRKDFQGTPFGCLNWRGLNCEDYHRNHNFEGPKISEGPGRVLSDFDPQIEYRYQNAAILHGPYSPF
jgi:hypothetical protein